MVGERRQQPGSGLFQCRADCTSFTTSPRYWHQAVSPAQDTLLAPLSSQFQGFPKHSLVCQPLTEVSSSSCYRTNSSLALQTLSATEPEVPPVHSSFTDKILGTLPIKTFLNLMGVHHFKRRIAKPYCRLGRVSQDVMFMAPGHPQ